MNAEIPIDEVTPRKDEELRKSVEAKFRQLSEENPVELQPIEPFSLDELKWIRERLVEAGYSFENLSNEGKKALSQGMFRPKVELGDEAQITGVLVFDHKKPEGEERWIRLEEFDVERFRLFIDEKDPREGDRSVGMYELLGEQRFRKLIVWSYATALKSRYAARIGGYPGTEGRRYQQTLTDIFQAVAEPSDEAGRELARRINLRLYNGVKRLVQGDDDKLNLLAHNFESAGEPNEDLGRLHIGSPIKIWKFLIEELPKV